MLITEFEQLVKLSRSGKPMLYRKRNSLALMFDVLAVQSEMNLDFPDELVLGYTQSMMGFLLFTPDPRSIGMIGLGGGSLTKFCLRHLPEATITVAEIDPEVIALREWFRIPQDDERLRIHCMDGADLVRQSIEQFDVLLVDGFDRHGQPDQLCSQDFYDDCYKALRPGGVMAVNVLIDTPKSVDWVERMKHSFRREVVLVDAIGSLNKVAFAYKGSLESIDDMTIVKRVERFGPESPVLLNLTAFCVLQQRLLLPPPSGNDNG